MSRVDKNLFEGKHYLGKPADGDDKIISRRVELVKQIPGFCNKELNLLEIGCGNGATLLLMSSEMKACKGVDIFDHTNEFEQKKTAQKITNCSVTLKNIEQEELDQQFERLICFEVIEHFKDDNSVKRFRNWITADAICAISIPNKWWIFETHGAKLPLLPWNRVPFFSWLPNCIHEKFANARIYTKARIRNLLEKNGFEVTSMQYITAPMDVLKDGVLKRFLVKYIFNSNTTSIPFLSTSIFVVAKPKPL